MWWDHIRLNLSPTTIYCKHLFWVLEKRMSPAGKRAELVDLVDRSAGISGKGT